MPDYIIKVENLGKKYRIRHQQDGQRYVAMRDVIAEKLTTPFRWLKKQGAGSREQGVSSNGNGVAFPASGSELPAPGSLLAGSPLPAHSSELIAPSSLLPAASSPLPASEDFWALRGVSFEVKQGEVVGIIGRNGAGKSTLLKILSRITEPTEGRVRLRGRVASLLEVGTGFHPELTGRENIYLNGAVLGMTRAEIRKKFDEIVAFAEVEKFLDTPVKRYSSGMYVRLAFAIAAHLDPDILIVDEVLAVGDVDFQKKCIGSMHSVARSGRTVLLVSHNLAMVESLCSNAILLTGGRIECFGLAKDVLGDYVMKLLSRGNESLLDHPRRVLTSEARFSSIRILDSFGNSCRDVRTGSRVSVELGVVANQTIQKPWIGIQIRTALNQLVFHVANREAGYELLPLARECKIKCHIQDLNLLPGRYFLDIILADMGNTVHDEISGAAYFDIIPTDILHTGMPMGQEYGMVFFNSQWEPSKGSENGNISNKNRR